jgi:hypothetical protein
MSAKAAIWARVSTDRQHEDNQIPDLERLCEHRGWEITRRYEIADASRLQGRAPPRGPANARRCAPRRVLRARHLGSRPTLPPGHRGAVAADSGAAGAQRLAGQPSRAPGSTARMRPPSCWPPSPHGSRHRSPCDAPSGFAQAWRAAEPRASRWAAPLRIEAKTSTRVAPRATSRHGRDAGQPNSRRNLCCANRIRRGRAADQLISVFITQPQRSSTYSLSGTFRSVVRHGPSHGAPTPLIRSAT